MALSEERRSQDEPRLPGELPPCFRRLHRHSYPANHTPVQRSLCTSLSEGSVAEIVPHDMQENHWVEEDDGNLFKVVKRLDDIIDRLIKSCKVKPFIESCSMDAGVSVAEPFNSRDMEDRLDKIIQKMSLSGCFRSLSKECYTTPTKVDVMTVQPLSSSRTTSSGKGVLPPPKAQVEDESDNTATPTSSFRLPLLTPRSLLSKFGSSEKADSPRRLSSSGHSKRFSAAFSFLSPSKRAGNVLSFRLGSSEPADGYA